RVVTASGILVSFTTILVTMPSVPSEPVNMPTRSYPVVTPVPSPSQVSSPDGVTTSRPVTWCTVNPCLRQCAPPEFSATLPPIEQTTWLDGSGAENRPNGAAALLTARLVTPGSTTARRLTGSISSTARIRDTTISTPLSRGSAPPDRPVPRPRATNGTPAPAHAATTAATSAAEPGKTTSAGTHRCEVSPSHS